MKNKDKKVYTSLSTFTEIKNSLGVETIIEEINSYERLKEYIEKDEAFFEGNNFTEEISNDIIDRIIDVETLGNNKERKIIYKLIPLLKKIYGSRNLLKLCAFYQGKESRTSYNRNFEKKESIYNELLKNVFQMKMKP